MTEVVLRCVMDASVGVELSFIEEKFSDKVQRLFAKLTENHHGNPCPDLFYIECANILLKYTRRFDRPLENSLADIKDLGKLALKTTSFWN